MTTYWISQVEQPANSPITKVCAFVATSPTTPGGRWSIGESKPYTRQQVVNGLKSGTAKLHTCTWNLIEGVWRRGAEVVLTKDEKYITTVGNSTTVDNLGSLPACTC